MDANATYRHTQRGWVILLSIGAGALAVFLICMFNLRLPAPAVLILMATGAVLIVVGWLFGSLQVSVEEGAVEIRFGPGLIRKRWRLDQFVSAEPVRNRWWCGWGIRLIPHGWLYNVSGLDAVELKRPNGRVLRIGTDDAAGLTEALRAAMKATPQ